MSDQLMKPCPFCGGSARIAQFERHEYEPVCASTMCLFKAGGVFSSEQAAVDAWNTRTSQPALAQGDALREAVIEVLPNLAALREIVWGGRSGQPYSAIANAEITLRMALSAQRELSCLSQSAGNDRQDDLSLTNAEQPPIVASSEMERTTQGVMVPRRVVEEVIEVMECNDRLQPVIAKLRALLGQREG